MVPVRMVTFNIQYSLGADGRYDLDRLVPAVAAADIVCLQEVERNWRRTSMQDQPARITERFRDRYVAYAPVLDVDASSVDVDGTVINRRRQFGQMTLSRWPIISHRLIHLPKIDTGHLANAWAGAQETVIATPDGPLRVVNVHLTDITETNRMTQAWSLVGQMATAPLEGGAWNGSEGSGAADEHWQYDEVPPAMPHAAVLLGDFNDEPDSAVLDVFHRAGYRDTWTPATARSEAAVTFKANHAQGTFRDMRIDFVLANTGVAVMATEIDVECDASDHQPVWATVMLRESVTASVG